MTPFPLHDRDLTILTAKAVGFRTIVRHEALDRRKESEIVRRKFLTTLLNLESLAVTDRNNLEIGSVLEEIAQSFEILLPVYHSDPEVLEIIIGTFRKEAVDYISIERELADWLQSMLEYSRRYLSSSSPQITIFLGAPELYDPPLDAPASAETRAIDSGRQITLYLRSNCLGLDSYFEIPGLLSHEFWCHSLSNFALLSVGDGCVPWTGSDPEDPWEEGWMDFVQNMILRSHDFPLPNSTCSIPYLHRATKEYESRRMEPHNGPIRSWGWGVALLVRRFFHQHYAKSDADDLFVELSVKLNFINILPKRKRSVVQFFDMHLSDRRERFVSIQMDLNKRVNAREKLVELISPAIPPKPEGGSFTRRSSIDINRLIMIVEKYIIDR